MNAVCSLNDASHIRHTVLLFVRLLTKFCDRLSPSPSHISCYCRVVVAASSDGRFVPFTVSDRVAIDLFLADRRPSSVRLLKFY